MDIKLLPLVMADLSYEESKINQKIIVPKSN